MLVVFINVGVDNTVIDVRRAVIKTYLLTGTYYLQADRDKSEKGISSTCSHCSAGPEDRLYFLTTCMSLEQIGQPFISRIKLTILRQNNQACVSAVLNDLTFLAQLVSCRLYFQHSCAETNPDYLDIEVTSRELCFALHLKRCSLLNQLNA